MKVGDYVRTKNGNIFKIVGGNCDNWEIDIAYSKLEQTEENWLELYRYNDNYSFFNDTNIIKTSPNIIDLIEVGDYVNGWRVNRVEKEEDGTLLTIGTITSFVSRNEKEPYLTQDYKEADKMCKIKSIVTKEQFESIEYRVTD